MYGQDVCIPGVRSSSAVNGRKGTVIGKSGVVVLPESTTDKACQQG